MIRNALLASFLVISTLSCGLLMSRADGVRVNSFRPVAAQVVQRHDAYVQADPLLSAPDKTAALAESADLMDALSKPIDGEVLVGIIAQDTLDICVRHDAYISKDSKLQPTERDIYLRSSMLLVDVIKQAESGRGPGGQ